MITVGDIRKAIEGISDSTPAIVRRDYADAEGALGGTTTQFRILAISKSDRANQLEIEVI